MREVVLLRFSHLGMAAVALIAVTGAVNTWRMLGMAPDPMDAYGRVLLAKIVLFGFMLVLAVTNRYWLMPQLAGPGRPLGVSCAHDPAGAGRPLRDEPGCRSCRSS